MHLAQINIGRLLHALDVEPEAVIFDDHANGSGLRAEDDTSDSGVRVTRNVGERLLHDPVHRAFNFRRLTIVYPIMVEHDGGIVMLAKLGQMRLQGSNQAEVVERGRVEQMGQIADAAQCSICVRLGIR